MVVIVEAAAEVRKRERDIAELVGEAFAREQVISEQRQQIAELAASAAAHEKRPPSMMCKDLKSQQLLYANPPTPSLASSV